MAPQEGGGSGRTRWQGRLGSLLGLRGGGGDKEGGAGWDAMWRQQQADHRGAERADGSSGVRGWVWEPMGMGKSSRLLRLFAHINW